MIRNPLTNRWEFLPIERWQEKDHQAHLAAYWNEQFRVAAEKAPKILAFPSRVHASVSRSTFKYPAYNEDPAAYCGDGLDPNPFND